jgi:hypothetical protein
MFVSLLYKRRQILPRLKGEVDSRSEDGEVRLPLSLRDISLKEGDESVL